MVLGQQPLLGAVVPARSPIGAPSRAALCSSARPFLVTRSWWVVSVVSTCQLANGIASSSSRIAAGSSWLLVCAWVSS